MKTIGLSFCVLIIMASCGRDATSSSQATQNTSPVINPVTEYFCKDEPVCKSDCDDKKLLCYGECDSVNNGNSLNIRNCKVFKCDGNYNTCMNEVYSK